MLMVSRKILEDILRKPLGPYRDCDILDEAACQMKGSTQLVLYSFVLEQGGHITGLDESETPLQGRDERRFRFRGVLKIPDPDWLSEFGLKTIEAELNLRARERMMRLGETARQMNGVALTLEGLFESGQLVRSRDATREGDGEEEEEEEEEEETRLEVVVQGEKNMPAIFMHSTRVPNGLLWNSKAHNRNYQVATMDVETYARSENFFWRWRLLALMDKICKRHSWVPTKKRTPGWFVEKYLATLACPPQDRHRRLIWDEADSDVDDSGRTTTPRHLLVPHMSEILGLLAAHAEWFITNNEVKRRQLFDVASWIKFARAARRQRKEAARVGVRWGWPEGVDEYEMSEEGEEAEEEEDDVDRLVRENPVIGKTNEAVARKIHQAQTKGKRADKGGMSSDSASDEGEEVIPRGAVEYASDFSDPEDPEEDEEDYRAAEEEAAELIPWQLQVPPYLPDVDGRWWCPLPECEYEIDLLDLTEEEGRARGVPEELVEYIVQKRWRNAAYDEKVLQGFKCMVTKHYMKHFEDRGVRAEKRDGKTRFVFVDGARRRRRGVQEPVRGPMPVRGMLGGEARVVPNVHAPQIQ